MAGSLPVLVAVDQDALEDVTAQLTQRYGRDYRVEGFGGSAEALRALTGLDRDGSEVALVLVGESSAAGGDGKLFDDVRRLHPHAKRALLVSANAWVDEPTAEAIRASMALGRIDHYVYRPASSPDEVFHEAVSDFLLEWAREQHLVPQTVHIVGEQWSGRAFELREVFRRCAVPHDFCLADSDKGRTLMAKAGPDAERELTTEVGRPVRQVRSSSKCDTSPSVADMMRNCARGSSSNGTCQAQPRSGSA